MKRRTCAFLLSAALIIALGPAASAQPEKEEWKKLEVHEGKEVVEFFIIPSARLRALGLKIEDIPDDQNAAFVYWQAFEAIPDLPKDVPGLDNVYSVAIKKPWSPEDGPAWKALYEWFQSTAEARKLLRKAAGMEKCRFPELLRAPEDDFSLFTGMLPHLGKMRNAARLCAIEGNLLQKQGRPREALEACLLTLPMGRQASEGDDLLIGTLVGIACIRIGEGAITGGLERANLDADTLKCLAERLETGTNCLPDRAAWLSFERAAARQTVRMPAQALELSEWTAAYGTRAFRILYPARTLVKDMDKGYDALAAMIDRPPWETAAALRNAGPSPGLAACKDWDVFAGLLLPGLGRAPSTQIMLLCEHDALRINVALRRCKLRDGEYPPSLDKLAPEFLKEIPPDPFSGRPFHYRLENGEWTLYSVGPSLKDHGGVAAADPSEGDRVFRSRMEGPK